MSALIYSKDYCLDEAELKSIERANENELILGISSNE